MEQWVLTVYKFTEGDQNSSLRLINVAVTTTIEEFSCHSEADVAQRTSGSHVYCKKDQPT